MTTGSPALLRERPAFRGRRHDLVREPDAGKPHVRFDERRLETEPRRGVRHRLGESGRQQLPPSSYRHRASRRLYRSPYPLTAHRVTVSLAHRDAVERGASTPSLTSSLRAHIGFMAEPGGALVRPHQPTGHQARFIRQRRPTGQDDRGVHREPQCLCLPLRPGRDGRVDLRQTRTSICANLRDITLGTARYAERALRRSTALLLSGGHHGSASSKGERSGGSPWGVCHLPQLSATCPAGPLINSSAPILRARVVADSESSTKLPIQTEASRECGRARPFRTS